jgi:hypothetical protein
MQTSSGDKIDLKMYDKKSSEVAFEKNGNSSSMMLSLTHSYGYSFHYEGNGIDAQDKKEIDAAMKTIEPTIEQYMENVKESEEDFSMSEITNRAFDINQYLPKTENLDTKNYLDDKTLKTIDKILEKAEHQNEKMLKHAQKLFESLLKQMDRFELYI